MAKLIFCRKVFENYLTMYRIYVNGKMVRKFAADDEAEVEVEQGQVTVQIKADWNHSNKIILNVEDKDYYFNVCWVHTRSTLTGRLLEQLKIQNLTLDHVNKEALWEI